MASTNREMMQWLFKLSLFLGVVFSASYVIGAAVTTDLNTFSQEASVLMQQIILSKALTAEEADRLLIGTIDLVKFESEEAEKKLDEEIFTEKRIAAKITLSNIAENREYESIYFHKPFFEEKEVLAKAGLKGPGAARLLEKSMYVKIKDKDALVPGIITVEVIMSNS